MGKERLAEIRKRKRQVDSGENDSNFWPAFLNKKVCAKHGIKGIYKVKENNKIVVVPPPNGTFSRKIYVYFSLGLMGDTVLAPYYMKQTADPVWEMRRKLVKKGASKKELKTFTVTQRALLWVVDLTDKDTRKLGVQAFPCAKSIEEELYKICEDDENENEVVDIADPENPYVIRFKKRKKGKEDWQVEYTSFRKSPLENALDASLYDVPDFDKVLVYNGYEELKKMVAETDFGDEEDEDKKKKGKKRKDDDDEDFDDVDDDDEDDDEDEDEDDDDEEDTKKSKKKGKVVSKKRKSKKDEEEDDDDSDDDSDDDEEDDEEDDDEEEEFDKKSKKKKGKPVKIDTKKRLADAKKKLINTKHKKSKK